MLIVYRLTFFRGVFIWQFASGGEKCHLQSISLTTFNAQKCTQTLRIVAIWLYNWFDTRPLKSIVWVVFPPGFPPALTPATLLTWDAPKTWQNFMETSEVIQQAWKRCVCSEQIYGKGIYCNISLVEVTLLNIYTA